MVKPFHPSTLPISPIPDGQSFAYQRMSKAEYAEYLQEQAVRGLSNPSNVTERYGLTVKVVGYGEEVTSALKLSTEWGADYVAIAMLYDRDDDVVRSFMMFISVIRISDAKPTYSFS